jgi:hypothetical protein
MKRCPICDKMWEINKVFCPWDGYRLKEMTPEEVTERMAANAIEPQFEVFEELRRMDKTLLDSLAEFGATETSKLVDIAISALEKRRERDQENVRDQMKLIDLFNLHCRTMQYFVDRLKGQSELFSFQIEHRDDVDQMYMVFVVSFGQAQYRRHFPVKITYFRDPVKEVTFEINLHDIADNKDKRHLKTERVGGKAETNIFGHKYFIAAPKGLEGIELLQWLENSFKDVFKQAYSVD